MKYLSALFTEARGSVAGATFSRNGGGLYVRSRAVPVNPQTAQQTVVRNALATLTSRWTNTLTELQRDGWYLYSGNVTQPNPIGQIHPLPGLPGYCAANVPRIQAGLPVVDEPPTTLSRPTFLGPTLTVDAAADEVDVVFNDSEDWVDEDDAAMIILASRPISPSRRFFKGPYRFAGIIAGDATTPPTSPVSIGLPFPVTAGNKVFFSVRISRSDGRLSSTFRGGVIAA